MRDHHWPYGKADQIKIIVLDMMSVTLFQIEISMSLPLMTQSFYLETQSSLAQNAMKKLCFSKKLLKEQKGYVKFMEAPTYVLVGEA